MPLSAPRAGILDPALRAEAASALEDLAPRLRAEALPPLDASLDRGHAGLALFFAELDRTRPGEGWDEAAAAHLERAAAGLEGLSGPFLMEGWAGVGWVFARLRARFFDEDPNPDLDAALLEALAEHGPRFPVEFSGGLGGLLFYALHRLDAPLGPELAAAALGQLEARAERSPAGLRWRTPARHAPAPGLAALFPQGHYDLGMAHGQAGLLRVLGLAAERGLPGARELLAPARDWLAAGRTGTAEEGWAFPQFLGPGVDGRVPSRLGWCHGELGVAAALHDAARRLGDAEGAESALAVARLAAGRRPELAKVEEPGLCHGALGLALGFRRLASADPALSEASRRWTAAGLAFRRPGEGLGGFAAWQSAADEAQRWRPAPGLLRGAAGAGLALAALLDEEPGDWETLFWP